MTSDEAVKPNPIAEVLRAGDWAICLDGRGSGRCLRKGQRYKVINAWSLDGVGWVSIGGKGRWSLSRFRRAADLAEAGEMG